MASYLSYLKLNIKIMKKNLLLLSISFFCASTFLSAQEPLKEAAIKTAEQIERKDSTSIDAQQEPTKKESSSAKKEAKSEGQNKMAINEQGVNKVKPKKKAAAKTKPDSTAEPKEKK